MKCSDCGGGECAGGFDQEISAVNGAALSSAKPRCKPLACGFLHLILPSPSFRSAPIFLEFLVVAQARARGSLGRDAKKYGRRGAATDAITAN
jgi:hypothetical protein